MPQLAKETYLVFSVAAIYIVKVFPTGRNCFGSEFGRKWTQEGPTRESFGQLQPSEQIQLIFH